MERVAIIAHLKEGSEQRAAELVRAGPPFDLADTGIVRHSVYVSAHEVVFVFEGHEVEWIVDQLDRRTVSLRASPRARAVAGDRRWTTASRARAVRLAARRGRVHRHPSE